jgi:hypothetical protein
MGLPIQSSMAASLVCEQEWGVPPFGILDRSVGFDAGERGPTRSAAQTVSFGSCRQHRTPQRNPPGWQRSWIGADPATYIDLRAGWLGSMAGTCHRSNDSAEVQPGFRRSISSPQHWTSRPGAPLDRSHGAAARTLLRALTLPRMAARM